MKNIKTKLILFLILLLTVGSLFAGGGNRRGTSGATELLIPVGARAIGMGNTGVMSVTGVDAMFWNPANLSRMNSNFEVMASHMSYIADMKIVYGAVGFKLGDLGTIGVSLKSLDAGDIVRTTTDFPDGTGPTFAPQYMTIGATYSKQLSDRVAVGLNINYVSEKLDLVEASGISFDFGVTYRNLGSIEGLSAAIAIKNLGSPMKFDGSGLWQLSTLANALRPAGYLKVDAAQFELPSLFDIGLGYEFVINEQNKLNLEGVFTNQNYYEDEFKFGMEYAYDNMIFVRAGYVAVPELADDERVYGFNAGFGINYKVGSSNIKLDYAFRSINLPTENGNHIITLGLAL